MHRVLGAAGLALIALLGCQTYLASKKAAVPELTDLSPVYVDYTDTDGFDAQFEASLVGRSPVVIVRTETTRPDWEGRLNAWIAAWNQGGRSRERKMRGQSPIGKLPLDSDSIKELRLLIDGLLNRVEAVAQGSAAWYADRRERNRRIALLAPYSLRFHRDGDGPIHLVFFHGDHAAHYPKFLQWIMKSAEPMQEEWTRAVECSHCKKAGKAGGVGRLVNRRTGA